MKRNLLLALTAFLLAGALLAAAWVARRSSGNTALTTGVFGAPLGALGCGMQTVWVNREDHLWTHEARPHETVTSLAELPVLLN